MILSVVMVNLFRTFQGRGDLVCDWLFQGLIGAGDWR